MDKDGIPDFKDCRPFNPRYHSKKQFDDAVKFFGTTKDPRKAAWILPSGEMLDFSGKKFNLTSKYEKGLGHIEIGNIMKDSVGVEAINNFQKLGAIRGVKEQSGDVIVSMQKKPTREQAIQIAKAINTSPKARYMLLVRVESTGGKQKDVEVLSSDHPHPVLVQKFISRAFR